jgi:hypothetical protein
MSFRHGVFGEYRILRSLIEAPLITREVLLETYFLLVIMAADAQARPLLQFKHHADVEPCYFLVSLAASSISEI